MLLNDEEKINFVNLEKIYLILNKEFKSVAEANYLKMEFCNANFVECLNSIDKERISGNRNICSYFP